ncbi:hypothetical protein [Paraglaciecola sp.]|uniref:hypothetical protein n=1 Tax=Paraglaciecola sp. TaxID=1920173 RepID=UPI0032647E1C
MRKSKRWNISFFACIDHVDISPIHKDWLKYLSGGRVSKDWPRLVEVSLDNDEILEARYSEDNIIYESTTDIAMDLCVETLESVKNESQFIYMVENVSESKLICKDLAILSKSILAIRDGELGPEQALLESESIYGKTLRGREYFSSANKKLQRTFGC